MPKVFSAHVKEVLASYPQWKKAVEQANSADSLPLDFSPLTIQIYDHCGLLLQSRDSKLFAPPRTEILPPVFLAWVLDSQLAFFSVGNEIVVNRLRLIATSFAIMSHYSKQ